MQTGRICELSHLRSVPFELSHIRPKLSHLRPLESQIITDMVRIYRNTFLSKSKLRDICAFDSKKQ